MFFVVRCDLAQGAEDKIDQFLTSKLRPWWIAQPGVRAVHIYRNALAEGFSTVDPDALITGSRRVLLIEIEDLASLQRLLDTEERRELRRQLLTFLTGIETQVQELIV